MKKTKSTSVEAGRGSPLRRMITLLSLAVAGAVGAFAGTDSTLRIAHVADPQFGFGGTYEEQLARFERLVSAVNAADVDVVYVAGDLTHRAEDVTRDWPRLVKLFKAPLLIAPGNHDVGAPVGAGTLERYVGVVGYDHRSLSVKGRRLIVANSQFCRGCPENPELKTKHDEWFFNELKAAKAAGEEPVVMSHIAPFYHFWQDKDTYETYPEPLRTKVINAALAAGTKFWLAGHTHKLGVHAFRGLQILNAEALGTNFDQRPYGWRLFELGADGDWSWNFRAVGAAK